MRKTVLLNIMVKLLGSFPASVVKLIPLSYIHLHTCISKWFMPIYIKDVSKLKIFTSAVTVLLQSFLSKFQFINLKKNWVFHMTSKL